MKKVWVNEVDESHKIYGLFVQLLKSKVIPEPHCWKCHYCLHENIHVYLFLNYIYVHVIVRTLDEKCLLFKQRAFWQLKESPTRKVRLVIFFDKHRRRLDSVTVMVGFPHEFPLRVEKYYRLLGYSVRRNVSRWLLSTFPTGICGML